MSAPGVRSAAEIMAAVRASGSEPPARNRANPAPPPTATRPQRYARLGTPEAEVSSLIRAELHRRNMTAARLARMSGKSESYLRAILNGNKVLRRSIAETLCATLDMKIDEDLLAALPYARAGNREIRPAIRPVVTSTGGGLVVDIRRAVDNERVARGMTIAELAALAGFRNYSLRHWLNGKVPLPVAAIEDLLSCLGLRIEYAIKPIEEDEES